MQIHLNKMQQIFQSKTISIFFSTSKYFCLYLNIFAGTCTGSCVTCSLCWATLRTSCTAWWSWASYCTNTASSSSKQETVSWLYLNLSWYCYGNTSLSTFLYRLDWLFPCNRSIFFLCIDVHNFHHPDPLMYEKCMHRVVVDSFKGVPTQ